MTQLLHIEASPRMDLSHSTRAARAFIEHFRRFDAGLAIDQLNVWAEDLPVFDGPALEAKYARLSKRELTDDQRVAWEPIEAHVKRLAAADVILISTPIWNFGIPYRLKHFFDLITQPGLTFSFDPETGYHPLLHSRPTAVIIASAGDYASGASFGRPDLATPYLRAALGFVGLDAIDIVAVAPTVGLPDQVASGARRAETTLVDLAARFAAYMARQQLSAQG